MGKIIALVGRSAVGKTELEKLLEKHYKYVPLISHTSRPKRESEKEGEAYYFRTNEQMLEMVKNDEVAEFVKYIVNDEDWYYALSKDEIEGKSQIYDRLVVTINPRGIDQLMQNPELLKNMVIFYLTGDRLKKRYMDREIDTSLVELEPKWLQRFAQDEMDFNWFDEEVLPQLEELSVPIVRYSNLYTEEREITKEKLSEIVRIIEGAIN